MHAPTPSEKSLNHGRLLQKADAYAGQTVATEAVMNMKRCELGHCSGCMNERQTETELIRGGFSPDRIQQFGQADDWAAATTLGCFSVRFGRRMMVVVAVALSAFDQKGGSLSNQVEPYTVFRKMKRSRASILPGDIDSKLDSHLSYRLQEKQRREA